MRECLNVLMLEWLARSNHSSNQAIRQSSNLFNLSTDNDKCGSNFQLSNYQTFKQSNNQTIKKILFRGGAVSGSGTRVWKM